MSEEDDYSESINEKPVDSTVPPALPTPPVSNLSTLPVSTVPMTNLPATTVPATTVPVQYRKLGRLEAQAHLEEEISLVKETKVIKFFVRYSPGIIQILPPSRLCK